MKIRNVILIFLIIAISACSQVKEIKLSNVSVDIKNSLNKAELVIRGKADWGKSKFKTSSKTNDLASSSTVSLIYPFNHSTNPNKVIATGLTDENGIFYINPSSNFNPQLNETFVLEVSKRLGGVKNSLMSMRTYLKWNSTSWESITRPSIWINSKTTALTIISEFEDVPVEKVINTIDISSGNSVIRDIEIFPLRTVYASFQSYNNQCCTSFIYVTRADGVIDNNYPKQVTFNPTGIMSSPVISPDGNKVAYKGYDGVNGTTGVYIVKSDIYGLPKKISPGYWGNFNIIPNDKELSFTFDSKKLIYEEKVNNNSKIFVADINDNLETILPKQITTTSVNNYNSLFSPDETKIAYIGTEDYDLNQKIFVTNSDSTNIGGYPKQISPETTYNSNHVFSRDGSKIAYTGYTNSSTFAYIFIANSDGSNAGGYPKQISSIKQPLGNFLSFSPDGTKILYVNEINNVKHIFIINSDGSTMGGYPKQISLGTYDNFFPVFSPDGSKVIYRGKDTITNNIYIANSDGSTMGGYPKQISYNSTENVGAIFSPDGSKILYSGKLNDNYYLFVANSDGSTMGGYPKQISTESIRFGNNAYIPTFAKEKIISSIKINNVSTLVESILNTSNDPIKYIDIQGGDYISTYP